MFATEQRDHVLDALQKKLLIRNSQNEVTTLTAGLLDSVRSIKKKLMVKLGNKDIQIALFYNGTLMEDALLLDDFDVPADNVIEITWTNSYECKDIDRFATGPYAINLEKFYKDTWAKLTPILKFDEDTTSK